MGQTCRKHLGMGVERGRTEVKQGLLVVTELLAPERTAAAASCRAAGQGSEADPSLRNRGSSLLGTVFARGGAHPRECIPGASGTQGVSKNK